MVMTIKYEKRWVFVNSVDNAVSIVLSDGKNEIMWSFVGEIISPHISKNIVRFNINNSIFSIFELNIDNGILINLETAEIIPHRRIK